MPHLPHLYHRKKSGRRAQWGRQSNNFKPCSGRTTLLLRDLLTNREEWIKCLPANLSLPKTLLVCFRFLWPCIVSKSWSERESQQDAAVRCLLSTLSQHVSGIIMPIFRRTRRVLLYVVCCAGSAGCEHPTTQRPTTATNHIQQNQRSTPHAVTHGLCSP